MSEGSMINPFGMASIKPEGEPIVYFEPSLISADCESRSRWIEVCYDPIEFKDTGVSNETIEIVCAEIESRFNYLGDDKKYAALTALINRLLPESRY